MFLFRVALLLAMTMLAQSAAAQTYPSRPIRLVVPYPPGGGTDTFARILARPLGERLAQQIVVDNRSGAGTILGTQIVASAPADGYTLLVNAAAVVINPLLHAKPPYDVQRDFAPVMQVVVAHNVLVANPGLGAQTLAQMIELAKAKPGAINYASTGVGTPGHLAGELLASMAGIKITHVPYRGGASLMPDLLAGQVQMSFVSLTAALPHVKAGRIRALGNASSKRAEALPDVPTIAEGGVPGYEATSWNGLAVRAGTPRPVIDRLQQETRKQIFEPAVKAKLFELGIEPIGSTPEQFAALIKSERAKWIPLFKKIGIQPQ